MVDSTERVWAHIDHILDSTEAFKGMDPSHKKCYLAKGEKTLKHSEQYSEADCMLECAWDLAKEHCKCVPWYMSKMYPSDQMCETFGNRLVKANDEKYCIHISPTHTEKNKF